MKKLFTFALALMLITSTFTGSYAQASSLHTENNFNLLAYLESHDVHSIAELESVIARNTSDPEIHKSLDTLAPKAMFSTLSNNEKIEEFKLEIDPQNELVVVTQVISTENAQPLLNKMALASTRATIYSKGATATKKVYSAVGMKIFTVKSEGEFQYDKSSYCKVTEAEGYFTSSFMSMWDSNCWIDDRDLGSTAYVKTYGTANLKLSVAEVLGINLTFQTIEYKLKLICDKYGNITSDWSEELN